MMLREKLLKLSKHKLNSKLLKEINNNNKSSNSKTMTLQVQLTTALTSLSYLEKKGGLSTMLLLLSAKVSRKLRKNSRSKKSRSISQSLAECLVLTKSERSVSKAMALANKSKDI